MSTYLNPVPNSFQIMVKHALTCDLVKVGSQSHHAEHMLTSFQSSSSPSCLLSDSDGVCPEQSLDIFLWGELNREQDGFGCQDNTEIPASFPPLCPCLSFRCSSSEHFSLSSCSFSSMDSIFFWMGGHFNQPPPSSLPSCPRCWERKAQDSCLVTEDYPSLLFIWEWGKKERFWILQSSPCRESCIV